MVKVRPRSWVFLFILFYILWVTPQDSAKWKTLLRYIFVVSFISIALVVVKLKILKAFHIDSVSMKWPLLEGFGPLLLQILFNLLLNIVQIFSLLSICLHEFLPHCLLCSVDFCDQFFTYFKTRRQLFLKNWIRCKK